MRGEGGILAFLQKQCDSGNQLKTNRYACILHLHADARIGQSSVLMVQPRSMSRQTLQTDATIAMKGRSKQVAPVSIGE